MIVEILPMTDVEISGDEPQTILNMRTNSIIVTTTDQFSISVGLRFCWRLGASLQFSVFPIWNVPFSSQNGSGSLRNVNLKDRREHEVTRNLPEKYHPRFEGSASGRFLGCNSKG